MPPVTAEDIADARLAAKIADILRRARWSADGLRTATEAEAVALGFKTLGHLLDYVRGQIDLVEKLESATRAAEDFCFDSCL